ncbi:hypothetical protein F5Y10DRAFT_281375 [Nemania abortiva]|nr:hypothetical protein F5Y10DRAFT_281375 [Nemania abortiva]
MTAPLLPMHSTSLNNSITRGAAIKCLGALLAIWAITAWLQFSGHSSPSAISPAENVEISPTVLDGVVPETSSHTEDLGLENAVPFAAPVSVKKHTDRVAVIVEDRPLGNLIPVILHFHSVLGPEWPVILYTSEPTSETLLRSAPLSRAVAASDIEIRHLPADTVFNSHASVSVFLTSPFLWTDLAPYAKILLFQADSIICSASAARVDDFLDYDLVGAPIDARFGSGFNGGLSAAADAPREWRFEDQWFFARMRELGQDVELAGELGVRVNLPDQETAERFALETIWVEGLRPLGFHQPHRWQKEHMDEIMNYCPEVGMIAGSSFFG